KNSQVYEAAINLFRRTAYATPLSTPPPSPPARLRSAAPPSLPALRRRRCFPGVHDFAVSRNINGIAARVAGATGC
ncbi:MAG: hypothetical protein OXU44_03015, partial [Gammaproteobacteria bacterium]|nr:hypothetical protein [Gammaproteobacteria bacterium]